ncbi:EamA family transporter, partial [Delftia tsuruhatensis]
MLESIQGFSWLWVPITLFAALAQTVRNTAQRSLTQELGALSATLVRFLYGLPFAMLWLALLYLVPAKPYAVPSITPIYLGWIALGAFFQLAGTVALLLAMKERNFAVAVTLTKTEVLQLALFASVFLHELPTPLALAAMIVATIGMLLLSLPPREQLLSPSAWLNRSALYGLACGSCFAVATV